MRSRTNATFHVITSLLLVVAFLSPSQSIADEPPPPKPHLAKDTLIQALFAETQGDGEQRAKLVETAVALAPDYAPARWHAGYVRIGDNWYTAEQAMQIGRGSALLTEYRRRRAEAPADDWKEVLTLARWCEQKKLTAEARAHFDEAIRLEPDNGAIRRAAGYQLFGGAWLRKAEIDAWKQFEERHRTNFREWRPYIVRIKSDYERGAKGNAELQAEALVRLSRIKDTAAIGPLNQLLATVQPTKQTDLELYRELIKHLGFWNDIDSTMALALHAVYAPTPELRIMAAEQMSDRQFEAYVPEMLASMSTLIRSKRAIAQGPGWRFLARTALYRETIDAIEVATVDEEIQLVDRVGFLEFAQAAAIPAEAAPAIVKQNIEIHDLNRRISDALQIATGHFVPPDPTAWWEWWNDWNENQTREKPVVAVGSYRVPSVTVISCFAPGTPVWTIRGLRAIENVQVGDRVLSQHTETGELDFKVVLNTTANPQHELQRVKYPGEELLATPGHAFWVSGSGWRMTRDLKRDDLLHTKRGFTPLLTVRDAAPGPTHNLVVEGFHTYFVGHTGVLVHDVTQRPATRAVVPGYAGVR